MLRAAHSFFIYVIMLFCHFDFFPSNPGYGFRSVKSGSDLEMDLAIGTYYTYTSASSPGPTTEPFKGACLLHQRLHRQKQLLHQLDQPYHLN